MNTTDHAAVPVSTPTSASPWLTISEAADRARCGVKLLYREVKAGRLKAARLGGRRALRFLREWIDQWMLESSTPTAAVRNLR